jgi:hypothetical protein
MPEETSSRPPDERRGGATNNEVALEMMKFIAVTTGYGKGATTATGFSGKASKSPEEYAEALMQLFEKCRETVAKGS